MLPPILPPSALQHPALAHGEKQLLTSPAPPLPPTGQLKTQERRLHSKLDMAQSYLETLAAQLTEMTKIGVPQSKNPFGGQKEAVQVSGGVRGRGGRQVS